MKALALALALVWALCAHAQAQSQTVTSLGNVVQLAATPKAVCSKVLAVNQIASTDLHTMANFGYICSIMLVSATAQSVSLVEGTGATCGTGQTALIGGATASVALAANGGFSAINPLPWLKMQNSGDHLCLLQSSTGNVSGIITYADSQ